MFIRTKVQALIRNIHREIWDISGVNHKDLNHGNIRFADDMSTAAFFDWGTASESTVVRGFNLLRQTVLMITLYVSTGILKTKWKPASRQGTGAPRSDVLVTVTFTCGNIASISLSRFR